MTVEILVWLLPFLLVSLVLHELAHAYVATWLGDPSPRADGRLSFNPIVHLDPLGTAMFVITALVSSFIFGWAKPVLINPRAFRRPQLDMAIVAAAGPATNLLLALGCVAWLIHGDLDGTLQEVVIRAFEVNVVLGIFNLIPIPPLDGSRIVAAVMPRRAPRTVGAARPGGDARALRRDLHLQRAVLERLLGSPRRDHPGHGQYRERLKGPSRRERRAFRAREGCRARPRSSPPWAP